MDISADLTELGRTPVAVICAGVKSILDIGRTLEYLVRKIRHKKINKEVSGHISHVGLDFLLLDFF